jgi:hypothetical protein
MNSHSTPSSNCSNQVYSSNTDQDKEEEETNQGNNNENGQEDVWEVIRVDLKKRGTESR